MGEKGSFESLGSESRVEKRVPILTPSFLTVNAKPNSVIPYSEVTNAIGNLLSARCRVIVFTGIFKAQSRGE